MLSYAVQSSIVPANMSDRFFYWRMASLKGNPASFQNLHQNKTGWHCLVIPCASFLEIPYSRLCRPLKL